MNTRFAEPEAQPIAAPVVPFPRMLERHGLSLPRTPLEILQVNLTARCNLACTHCHVESGPKREEALDARGIDRLIAGVDGAALQRKTRQLWHIPFDVDVALDLGRADRAITV